MPGLMDTGVWTVVKYKLLIQWPLHYSPTVDFHLPPTVTKQKEKNVRNTHVYKQQFSKFEPISPNDVITTTYV